MAQILIPYCNYTHNPLRNISSLHPILSRPAYSPETQKTSPALRALYCHSRIKVYGWSIHSLKRGMCLSISTIPTTAPVMNAVKSVLSVLPWDIEGSVRHAHLPHKTLVPSLALTAPVAGFFSTSPSQRPFKFHKTSSCFTADPEFLAPSLGTHACCDH